MFNKLKNIYDPYPEVKNLRVDSQPKVTSQPKFIIDTSRPRVYARYYTIPDSKSQEQIIYGVDVLLQDTSNPEPVDELATYNSHSNIFK